MEITILTLFPEMFAPLTHSMIQRARTAGVVKINVVNIRDYASDKHQTTDERLYGGGSGMVLKPEPLAAALAACRKAEKPRVIVTSPAGRPFNQKLAAELAREEQLIIICGHYEGIDQRFIDRYASDLISLGDFVMTGGEIAALAITDSVTRLLPGALGDERAAEEESFTAGLLEYPQYTRPPVFEGLEVPQVLQGGNHAAIARWRRERSLELTYGNRPELLATAPLDTQDAAYLAQLRAAESKPFRLHAALLHYPVYNKKKQVVNTSLTNLDLHDIARASRTYALAGYYLVQPIESQRQLMAELLTHWRSGFGATYNPDRTEALSLVSIVPQLADAIADISEKHGSPPRIIVTGAGLSHDITGYGEMRRIMEAEGGDYLLVFGTGYGLSNEVTDTADFRLSPIYGLDGYNHLSVRSAAAIILDRLMGDRA
jgi:tRNA (guanine37-N1)-methyltransferase